MEKLPTRFRIIDMEILNPGFGGLIKTAAIALPPGEVFDPEYLYTWVRAVSAGEYWGPNRNADFFPEEELKKSHLTFLEAYVFKNHENKDVARALGRPIQSVWNDPMKYVELLIKTDRRLAPDICRNVEKGMATDVSMGCKVKYSVCSICGNVAKTRQDFCEHINKMRNEILPDGRQVYEINYGPRFHDISWVLSGADRTAKIQEIDPNLMKRAAAQKGDLRLEKAASLFIPQMRDEVIRIIKHTPPAEEEPLFKSAATTKEAFLKKFGEMEKVIRSKIIGISGLERGQQFSTQADDVMRLIKVLYTRYWDQDRTQEIADSLKRLAAKNQMPIELVLQRFLGITELLGIELTPLELDRVLSAICDCNDQVSKENAYTRYAESIADPLAFARNVFERTDHIDDQEPVDMARVARLYPLMANPNANTIFDTLRRSGVSIPTGLHMIVVRMRGPAMMKEAAELDDELIHLVQGDMAERSHYASYLLPRMAKIASGEVASSQDGIKHFAPLLDSLNDYTPASIAAFAYGQYQANRVKLASDPEFFSALSKHAALVEGRHSTLDDALMEFATFDKSAAYTYPLYHRIMFGAPLIYGYTQWQRARLNNDENLNTFQRFAVENPNILQAVNFWLGGKAFRGIQSLGSKGYNKIKDVGRTLGRMIAIASEMDNVLEKTASNPLQLFSSKAKEVLGAIDTNDIDIYLSQNPEIDAKIGPHAGWVKAASLYYEMGREDVVDELKRQHNISDDDIAKYVLEMKKYAHSELDKLASTMAGEFADGNGSFAWLTGLPGIILNAYLVDKIAQKHNKNGS